MWELSPEIFLSGGLGLLLLAPLTVKAVDLPGVIQKMQEKLKDREPELAENIFAATEILMGLKFEDQLIAHVLEGVCQMKESVVYQRILAEGEARGESRGEARGEARGEIKGVRATMILIASDNFGPPNEKQLGEVNRIEDIPSLNRMIRQVNLAKNWDDFLKIN